MQESRLFKIVYYLLEKGQATAPELAEKLEVSARTIYRDMDALSEAGIPIYAEAGRNGGIRLMNHFVLDRAVLSAEEKQEVLAALRSLGAAGNAQGGGTLQKLAALFDVGGESWLEVDFSRWGRDQRDNEKFVSLKTAVIRHTCLEITYAGSGGTITRRTVQPLKLCYKSRAWYLKAYCEKSRGLRLFKLSRILEWEVLDRGFTPYGCLEEEETPSWGDEPVIRLRFPEEVAYRVYDEFDLSDVERMENGDLLVCSRMPEDVWLVGYLLSFGEKVEVIEPAHLRSVLAAQAKAIYEKNKS